jgi:hypothetical protein
MDDQERMLEQGPREAPEPLTAEAMSGGQAPAAPVAPVVPDASAEPRPESRPRQRPAGPMSLVRLIPLVLVGLLVGLRALGVGGPARIVVVAAIALVGLLGYLRRRNR